MDVKVLYIFLCSLKLYNTNIYIFFFTEPEIHFNLVKLHISEIRKIPEFEFSRITVFVERNLGFEAEHFERNLKYLEGVHFYRDLQACRTGILTTENVKLAAMTMTNVLLREQRVCILPGNHLISKNPQENRRKLREQLEIYSFQFKTTNFPT